MTTYAMPPADGTAEKKSRRARRPPAEAASPITGKLSAARAAKSMAR
jgi:hypothetical protein